MKYLSRVAFFVAVLAFSQVSRAVTLSTTAVPSSGVAGTSSVHITGSGFPKTNTAANTTVSFGTSCLALTTAATTTATHVTLLGSSTELVYFTVPGTLPTGSYAVWVTGTSPAYDSTTCSVLNVTNSNAVLGSCIPSSSLAVSVGPNVTAYVPNGAWAGGSTGVQVVRLEGTPTAPAPIPTPNVVNACSTNSLSGETVCTANNTDVYEITGTTLNKTLTSGATTFASFSGGSCFNCGVAIDAASNRAILEVGLASSPSRSGVQLLNLSNDTFNAAVPLSNIVSENIATDPNRSLIVSPGERGFYDVLKEANDGTITEFAKFVGVGEFDSGAEDCTTGNALASIEFTNRVYIQDLSQAVYTPGSPGTYTAPSDLVTLVTSYGFSAGTSGISIAPGKSHLAVVTGEFGGRTAAVLQLPATSGSGTPTIVDYAVFAIPSSSACGFFNAGLDPHTVTAYTSPNDGKAYAVFAGGGPPPACLARIDLAALLAAPRGGGGLGLHDVAAADFPAGAATFYPTH